MVSVSVRYLFYQPVDEKIKTWPLRFPAKENPNMEKALFDWPIVLQYDVKPKYRLISRKFSGVKFVHPSVRLTNQKQRRFVYICSITNQIALFLCVCCVCFVRAFSFQGHTKIALLRTAGCNQSLIQSHTQRKSLTMVYRKNRLSRRRPIQCIYWTQAKNMGQTF